MEIEAKKGESKEAKIENIAYPKWVIDKLAILKSGNKPKALRKLEVGRYLCMQRLMRGLSQEEAAEELGITRESWNRIEMGRSLPAKRRVRAIADLMKISDNDLMNRCGYFVREEYPEDELETAVNRLRSVFTESNTESEFIMGVVDVWNEHRNETRDFEGQRVLAAVYERKKIKSFNFPMVQATMAIKKELLPYNQMILVKEILLGEATIAISKDPKAKEILEEVYEALNIYFSRQKNRKDTNT